MLRIIFFFFSSVSLFSAVMEVIQGSNFTLAAEIDVLSFCNTDNGLQIIGDNRVFVAGCKMIDCSNYDV